MGEITDKYPMYECARCFTVVTHIADMHSNGTFIGYCPSCKHEVIARLISPRNSPRKHRDGLATNGELDAKK